MVVTSLDGSNPRSSAVVSDPRSSIVNPVSMPLSGDNDVSMVQSTSTWRAPGER